MAMDHTSFELILGGVLQNSRKIEGLWIQTVRADNANYNRRRLSIASGIDFTDTEEARMYSSQTAFWDTTARSRLESDFRSYRSKTESDTDLFGIIKSDASSTEEDDNADGAIEYLYDEDLTDGTIAIVNRIGRLGALFRAFTTDSQTVLQNVISFGTFTADSTNTGTLSVTTMTGSSHTPTSTLVVECTGETVDAPVFSINLEMDGNQVFPDGRDEIEADNDLTAEKSFQDGPTGLTITLTRPGLATPVEAGDDGLMFSASSIATPAESDMNGGVLQVKVTRQATAPIWLIEFYNSSARTTKVGSVTTDTTAGTFSVDVTMSSGTRFQSTFDRAAANTQLPSAGNNDNDISFDIQSPRVGDRWTRTVTNDEAGNFATKMMKLWPMSLPVSGTPTYTDASAASISFS